MSSNRASQGNPQIDIADGLSQSQWLSQQSGNAPVAIPSNPSQGLWPSRHGKLCRVLLVVVCRKANGPVNSRQYASVPRYLVCEVCRKANGPVNNNANGVLRNARGALKNQSSATCRSGIHRSTWCTCLGQPRPGKHDKVMERGVPDIRAAR